MAKAKVTYPFVPKSTAHLRAGQFWSIPLANGRFACGRVLQLKTDNGKLDSRMFLAALMDWHGDAQPTADAIAGASIIRQGAVHVKTISENRGEILGFRSLEADGIEPGLFLDESPGRNCHLCRGFEILGIASPEQQATLKVFSTWGYSVIKNLAEKNFG